jgi:putative FmdB family regulatory protein
MPLYDYKCKDHGVFHALATMEDAAHPQPCPVCSVKAARVILLSPTLFMRDANSRQADARNEKARFEPLVSTSAFRAEEKARHVHKHGDNCCQHKPIRKSMLFYTADGDKMFPSARPWMISH